MTPNSDTAAAEPPRAAAPASPGRDERASPAPAGAVSMKIGTTLWDAQREIILATLEHFQGDKRRAAAALGISLKTLYNRLALYRRGPAVT